MRIKTLFLFCQCLIICSRWNTANALIGAYVRQAEEGEFPFVVAVAHIQTSNPLTFRKICIGSLITKKNVLSAEHCFFGQSLPRTIIVAGSVNITMGLNYRIFWWLSYRQWMIQRQTLPEFTMNDVTLIRLLTDVPDSIVPASISRRSNEDYYGEELTIATWTRRSDGVLETLMHVGVVRVLSNRECELRAANLSGRGINVPQRIFCTAAEPLIQLSQGDSGGPLFHQNTIVGINSGLFPDVQPAFHPQKVNIHFGIKYYRRFIISVSGQY